MQNVVASSTKQILLSISLLACVAMIYMTHRFFISACLLHRETFLFALRLCVAGGGKKMGAAIRQEMTKTITSLMSHSEDSIRTAAAACLGALITCLPDEEKTDVVLNHVLGMYSHIHTFTLFFWGEV